VWKSTTISLFIRKSKKRRKNDEKWAPAGKRRLDFKGSRQVREGLTGRQMKIGVFVGIGLCV